MIDPKTGLPPRFLRTPDAARFLGISLRTLEKHRTYGTGPTYRKIGGRVVYALEDLQAWTAVAAEVVVAALMGWAAVRELGGAARRIPPGVREPAA